MPYPLELEFFNSFVIKGPGQEFHVEESRMKGGFNEQSVDIGVRAWITDPEFTTVNRPNAIIYSGIYNSRTRTNNLNQFPVDKDITKAVDIQYGSIQHLFAEDTNLNIFQEEKVHRALIDKDAIYTAEGGRLTASAEAVIGEIISYGGNYGIGKNPESFAYFAGRKYFTDKPKGLVLRLSRDGVTEISNYGMRSFFRDNLSQSDVIQGSWDMYNQYYVISATGTSSSFTVSFDETSNGWTSFWDFVTDEGSQSLDAQTYSFKAGQIWKHYASTVFSNFYGVQYDAYVDTVMNSDPSRSKNILGINYEGTNTWDCINITTDTDSAYSVDKFDPVNQDLIISAFKRIDGKYFSYIVNSTPVQPNEVSFGEELSGIKGFWLNSRMRTQDSSKKQELFAVNGLVTINEY